MTKRAKYMCKFNEKRSKDFVFIQPSKLGVNSAHCSLCKGDFSIGAGAKNDIDRHCQSKKHQQHERAIKGNSLGDFFQVGNKEMKQVSNSFKHMPCVY
jgi:hypothetical protein